MSATACPWSTACCALSTTQGPAISTRSRRPSTTSSATLTSRKPGETGGGTGSIYIGVDDPLGGWVPQSTLAGAGLEEDMGEACPHAEPAAHGSGTGYLRLSPIGATFFPT